MNTVVRELVARDQKCKVEIFQRVDGSFGFSAWRFSDDEYEMCWIPDGRFSECFTLDAKTAESEARSRVGWLRDESAIG